MPKLLLVISLFFFFILLPQNVDANWVKSTEPVIKITGLGWDGQSITSINVIRNHNTYEAWYHAYFGDESYIGRATSMDGLEWNKNLVPVIIPDNSNIETNVETPSVIKRDKYYMWFLSYNNDVVDYKIRMAVSEDGINWVKHREPVLVPSEPWETRGITDPSVIYHDGKYRMFYGGWGVTPWQIGYAESLDGITWTKSPNNPLQLPGLGHMNGPSASFYDGKYHLYYHTGGMYANTIYHVSSADLQNWECEDGCVAITSTPNTFDSLMTLAPDFVANGDKQYLYYAGSSGGGLQIGLAINQLISQKPKIIIIPGFLASWNEEAIIHNQTVGLDQWSLNPIVKDYAGIFATLDNLGYEKNKDYYLFTYDWRKGLDSIVGDFESFVASNQLQEEKLNLVGHSLGGLVARIYTQKHTANVEKVVTLGSPHQGVAQVYKALAGGEFEESNSILWLVEKLAIQLYRTGLETDREILNTKIPALKDILAIYPYLYDQNNQPLPYQNYQYQNQFLLNLSDLSGINSLLHSLAGRKGETLFAYKLGARTLLDKLTNNYLEGRPVEIKKQIGDFVVPALSAETQNHASFNFDHGELVHKKESIGAVLEQLEIDYESDQLVEGEPTNISPSLIFLVMSPIDLEVEIGDKIYADEQGILLIENPGETNFVVRAIGKAAGDYSIIIGSLKANKDSWIKINGTINSSNPTSQIDLFHLNNKENLRIINQLELLDQIIFETQQIQNKSYSPYLQNTLNSLSKIKNANDSKKNKILPVVHLLQAHHNLYKAIKSLNVAHVHDLLDTGRKLEQYYAKQNSNSKVRLKEKILKAELKLLTLLVTKNEESWLRKGRQFSPLSIAIMTEINTKFLSAKQNIDNSNFSIAEIEMVSIGKLFKHLLN